MALSQPAMHALAANFSIVTGTVIHQLDSKAWRILTEQGQFIEAHLAVSCLVEPRRHSEVLIAQSQHQCYLLAVLTEASSHLNLVAKNISLHSEQLVLTNKTTTISTKQLRFDTRRMIAFAKRAYFNLEQLWQKSASAHIESKFYKHKANTVIEEIEGLHSAEAKVVAVKAEVISQQADKILLN